MNIRTESTTHIEESLIICHYQIDKFNLSDLDNINYISKDVVSLWQEIIHYDDQEAEEDVDMYYVQNESNLSWHHYSFTRILEPIIDEIEMLEEHLTKLEYNWLGQNPQAIILCDIIKDRLSLNHL